MSKVIRDFIYLDIDRLYSLYSQIFDGLPAWVVDHDADHTLRAREETSFFKTSESSEQAHRTVGRTETKVLLDHAYSKLEDELNAAILEPTDLGLDTFQEYLSDAFMVKVRGRTEIQDYTRIVHFAENFPTIAKSIAFSQIASSGVPEDVQQLINEARQALDPNSGLNRNERKKLRSQVEMLDDPETLAALVVQAGGMGVDPRALDALKDWVRIFYQDAYEVIIVREGSPDFAFRGIIDPKWLRISRDYMRTLYGGFNEGPWVMVGEITHLPGGNLPEVEEVNLDLPEIEQAPDRFALREPFRGIFRSSSTFDRMFFESARRVECLVRPLAIYKEVTLAEGKIASTT